MVGVVYEEGFNVDGKAVDEGILYYCYEDVCQASVIVTTSFSFEAIVEYFKALKNLCHMLLYRVDVYPDGNIVEKDKPLVKAHDDLNNILLDRNLPKSEAFKILNYFKEMDRYLSLVIAEKNLLKRPKSTSVWNQPSSGKDDFDKFIEYMEKEETLKPE